jgi:peptidoglycan/LPS O-acetylase OafA/YrhL
LLDTLRIFAATAVFLGHSNFPWFFGGGEIGPKNGQDYVIIFLFSLVSSLLGQLIKKRN